MPASTCRGGPPQFCRSCPSIRRQAGTTCRPAHILRHAGPAVRAAASQLRPVDRQGAARSHAGLLRPSGWPPARCGRRWCRWRMSTRSCPVLFCAGPGWDASASLQEPLRCLGIVRCDAVAMAVHRADIALCPRAARAARQSSVPARRRNLGSGPLRNPRQRCLARSPEPSARARRPGCRRCRCLAPARSRDLTGVPVRHVLQKSPTFRIHVVNPVGEGPALTHPEPARHRTAVRKSCNAARKRRGSLLVWLEKDMAWLAQEACKPRRPPVCSQ